jgi:hypothetical protein
MAGRKKLPEDQVKATNIGVPVNPQELATFRKLAKYHGRTLPDLIRYLLAQECQRVDLAHTQNGNSSLFM